LNWIFRDLNLFVFIIFIDERVGLSTDLNRLNG